MKLTPLDIHHKEFRNSIRGYNAEEVDDFLDEVADEFERLFKENIDLSERCDSSEQRLRAYADMEQTLQKTLVSAQTSADDMVARAKAEAERLVREAETKAQEIVTGALEDKQRTQQEISRLQAAEEDFRAKFQKMLNNYLAVIEPVSGAEAAVAAAEPVAAVEPDEASELIQATGFSEAEPEFVAAEPEVEADERPASVMSLQLGEIGDAPEFEDDMPALDTPAEYTMPRVQPIGELDDIDVEEID